MNLTEDLRHFSRVYCFELGREYGIIKNKLQRGESFRLKILKDNERRLSELCAEYDTKITMSNYNERLLWLETI